jgi:hypothetical protein
MRSSIFRRSESENEGVSDAPDPASQNGDPFSSEKATTSTKWEKIRKQLDESHTKLNEFRHTHAENAEQVLYILGNSDATGEEVRGLLDKHVGLRPIVEKAIAEHGQLLGQARTLMHGSGLDPNKAEDSVLLEEMRTALAKPLPKFYWPGVSEF